MPQFTPPSAANERIDSCLRRNGPGGTGVCGRIWHCCRPWLRDSCLRRNDPGGNGESGANRQIVARQIVANPKPNPKTNSPSPTGPFLRRQESILNMGGNAASLRRQCRNLRRRWRQMKVRFLLSQEWSVGRTGVCGRIWRGELRADGRQCGRQCGGETQISHDKSRHSGLFFVINLFFHARFHFFNCRSR